MELFKKNKSTINKIGNGQTQSGRIPMTQGTSPLLQGRALGNSTPTLPGTNVPFRNEEQYQRSLGNMTRIPASPQATQSPMTPLNATYNPNDNPMSFGPNMARTVRTDIAPEEMGTEPKRIPVSAAPQANNKLASAGITTDAVYAPTSGDRGIPLSAVADIPATTPQATPQIPVGLIGEPGFEQSKRIPAQAPTFDSTLSLQEQINQIENEYNRKAQDLYAEGGLRGMTAGAASSLENVFRQRELSELTPLQQRLELLQAQQESEQSQTQQEFENQLALSQLQLDTQKAGIGGSSSGLSDTAIAIAQGLGQIDDLTPSQKGQVLGEFARAGIEPPRPDADKIMNSIADFINEGRGVERVAGLSGTTTIGGGILPGKRGSIADLKNIQNILTLAETGKMTGVLSESDIQILKGAATALKKGLSEEKTVQELAKIYKASYGWLPDGYDPVFTDKDGNWLPKDKWHKGTLYTGGFIGPDGNMYENYELEDIRKQSRLNEFGEMSGSMSFNQAVPQDLGTAMQKIKAVESSGNYQARGPIVTSGQYAGERALGAYQVMPGNLPQWSREALGRQVSEQEFLNNPQIQDQIVAHQFAKNYQKYGNWDDAASVWFTGRPIARAGNASDVTGTTVQEYINRFRQA